MTHNIVSNEAERAHVDIYDDFKLKNPLVSMVQTKINQRRKDKEM